VKYLYYLDKIPKFVWKNVDLIQNLLVYLQNDVINNTKRQFG